MNFKTTIAMGLVLVLLLGVYFFAFRGKNEKEYQKRETIREAYGIKKSDVTKIHLEYKDGALEPFTLAKEDTNEDNWRFTKPTNARADKEKVDKLLEKLLDRKVKRRITKPNDFAKYGLDAPRIKYTVWTKNKSRKFLIGNKGISYSVYAKEAEEDSVITIEHTVLKYLSKSPADLRDRSIFDFQTDKVTQVTLNYPDRSVVCKFNKNREWEIVEPIHTKADFDEMNKFLNNLNELEVEAWEEVDELGKVSLEVAVSTEDSQTILQVGRTKSSANRVYAKLKDNLPLFSINEDVVAKLTKTVYDLRDKQVIDFQRVDVNKFVIERPDVRIVCERNPKDEWSIVEPISADADKSSIDDLLFGLDALKAKEFLGKPGELKDLKKYGLERPSIKIILFEKSTFVLLVGSQKDDMLYVIADSPNSDQVYLVENDILEEIRKKPSDLRDKRITDFYSGDAVELLLSYDDKSITYKKYGDDWRISKPINVDADDSKVKDILYILNKIKAQKFVLEHESLRNPPVSAMVKLNDETVYTLLVGDAADEDSVYAKVKELEGAFTIDKSIMKKLIQAIK